MPKLRNEKQLMKFDYDFSEDGGAQGTINLRADISDLQEGDIITDMYVYVETALASSGSSHTVTLGNTDADGFMADFASLATSNDSVIRIGEVAGALMFDDTNDHLLAYRVSSDTALDLTVGTEDLTTGKLSVYVEVFSP